MGEIDSAGLLYVAGIGLLCNVVVFTLTLLVYLCKARIEDEDDEDEDEDEDGLNAALLRDEQEERENQQRLIDLIPSMKFKRVESETASYAGDGCSICLKEGFEEEEVCKVLPECNHVFHSHCIDRWFITSLTCPVCRQLFGITIRTL